MLKCRHPFLHHSASSGSGPRLAPDLLYSSGDLTIFLKRYNPFVTLRLHPAHTADSFVTPTTGCHWRAVGSVNKKYVHADRHACSSFKRSTSATVGDSACSLFIRRKLN